MSTAAAQIHEAFKERQANQPIVKRDGTILETTNRYLWFPAEDIPHSEATAGYVALMRERAAALGIINPNIPSCWIERLRVAPVLAMPVWEVAESVPTELRVKGRNPKPNGDWSEYQYLVPPGHIFDAVMDAYQPWGLRELEILRGGDPGDVLELRIDDTFFPGAKDRMSIGRDGLPVDELPRAYSAQIAQINQVITSLKGDSRRATMEGIAIDMLRSIEVSKAFDVALVEFEESQKELRYSAHALRALTRLERQRRDHAMNAMAERQNETLTALPEMIKQMAAANAPSSVSQEDFAAAVSIGVGAAMEKVMEKFGAMFAQAPQAPATPEAPKQSNNRK